MVKTYPDLERGESASVTRRRHIPTRVFKQAVRLTKKAAKIQATLADVNVFNAGKKAEEALALLRKFFPDLENFETQVRKYRREIDRLEKNNAVLAKQAEAGEKASVGRQLESAKLQADYKKSTALCGLTAGQ